MLLRTSEKLTNNKITSLHALFLLFLFREKSMIGICLPVVGTRSSCKHRMKGRRLTNKTKLKCILYNTHAIHPMASKPLRDSWALCLGTWVGQLVGGPGIMKSSASTAKILLCEDQAFINTRYTVLRLIKCHQLWF